MKYKYLPPMSIVFLLPLAFFSTIALAEKSDDWLLMSGHGECADIKLLERKILGIGGITDPASFSNFMKKKGYTVSSSELTGPKGTVVQVDIADAGLNLIFVKRAMCP